MSEVVDSENENLRFHRFETVLGKRQRWQRVIPEIDTDLELDEERVGSQRMNHLSWEAMWSGFCSSSLSASPKPASNVGSADAGSTEKARVSFVRREGFLGLWRDHFGGRVVSKTRRQLFR